MSEDPTPLDVSRSATELLAQIERQAAAQGEMTRIILDGACEVDSELIRRHLLAALRAQGCREFRFTCPNPEPGPRLTAQLILLPDGSAFACDIRQRWLALSPEEARATIEHLGRRYAPGNHWTGDFTASLDVPDSGSQELSPMALADLWQTVCSYRPTGFSDSLMDHLEAWGHAAYSHAFGDAGKLGL